MNKKETTLAGLLAVAWLFTQLAAQAVIVGPYTADANTLHLWHMDASAVPVPDAVSTGSTNLMKLANGALLGASSYSTAFGTALNTADGGQDGIAAADKDAYLAASPTTGNVVLALADPTTSAFTFEALVWIGFDPAKDFSSTANGGNGRAAVCEIMTGESNTSANRVFQFRIAPIGCALGNTTVNLEFVNVNLGASQNLSVPIPTTGPDAILGNKWYHAAVTYNGLANTGNNITLYWTLMDTNRMCANAIGASIMANDLPVAPTVFALGNIPGRTANANFLGLIDEARISNIARSADDMMFGAKLCCAAQAGHVNLSWPTNSPVFTLQYRTNLTKGNWLALGGASIVNGQFTVSETAANTGRFYRLMATPTIPQLVDTTVVTRKAATINNAYIAPWPDTNAAPTDTGGEFLGKSAYALTAYYLHSNLATADAFINALHDTSYLGVTDSAHYEDTSTDDLAYEFSLPLLIRIGMCTNTSGTPMINTMSATARTNLLDMIWCAMHSRSDTNDAGAGMANVWGVLGSENHNAVWRSAFFLGAQLLNGAGAPYGPGNSRNKLLNGGTLQQHYDAWFDYWFNYFRQRAREGISMEVCSPTYEKYTLAACYDLMDCGGTGSDRAVMQQQASNYLTLYWADAANEFSPGATIRGGAGCRMYQDNHLTTGTASSLREWLYMYDWDDTDPTGTAHPEILTAAMSPYMIPDLVKALAVNTTKAPYEYNSHRLGAGTDDTYGDTIFYHLSTPTYVRRDTQWTPDFIIGSMTYDSTKSYNLDTSENQFASVLFSSGVDDRLIVQGIGTAKSGTADTRGVTSASNLQTLVASLGKDIDNNAGMRIFVANTLYGHLKTNGNWLVTYAGNGYAAIRIATGGFTWVDLNNDGTTCTDGIYLKLGTTWSPLVIQCARAADYANNFNSFTSAVVATSFTWDATGGVMTYTSLLGQQFKVWSQSDTLPWVGGSPRSQSPSYLYKSPYISADYGDANSDVTLMYPGFDNLVLHFDSP